MCDTTHSLTVVFVCRDVHQHLVRLLLPLVLNFADCQIVYKGGGG